jgi:quinolinate synthase
MNVTDLKTVLAAAEPLIELAIKEDIGPGDATSTSTLPARETLIGCITAKERGVIAGLPVVEAVFRRVDPQIRFSPRVDEGQEVVPGEIVADVSGPGPALLAAERIALNFFQRMSGIATQTRDFVDAVATTDATILDTRKTLPGFRVLDKYAVRMGGGTNHRLSLFDMMMVKDNHIDGAGGLTEAVTRARARHPELPVEVEVRTLDELREALRLDPPLDRVLLDNMPPETLREAVAITDGRVPLEASGGVTLETVATIAGTGVDYVSVGALTHSVEALDLSMTLRTEDATSVPDPAARIREVKAALGDRLVILGHHYQRDEVIALADYRGDSLQLSRQATQTDADDIVFCGVHFMAEVAAILAQPGQHVLIPDPSAGCYLADTANPTAVRTAWEQLDAALGGVEAAVTPITYVNSSAALKAFCGEHGGIVCTSGNAPEVLRWAFERRPKVFFFPDQHLATNTAHSMDIPDAEILRWDLRHPPTAEEIRAARVIVWPGACNVHQRFTPEHVRAARERYPDVQVIVHPECKAAVVELADKAGSTATILREIAAAPEGSVWAVGTETRLVKRLQQEHPEQTIVPLADVPPYCATMSQTTVENLAAVLDALARGERRNVVTVAPAIAEHARTALERMLSL